MRRSIAAGVAVLALAVPLAGQASAAVTVTPKFELVNVTGSRGDDRILIECRNDRLFVNGRAALRGRAFCSDLRELDVRTFRGADRVSVRLPEPGAPTGFAFMRFRGPRFELSTGRGDDDVLLRGGVRGTAGLGPGDDSLRSRDGARADGSGGAGADVLDIEDGRFTSQSGGPGDDRLLGSLDGFSFILGGPGEDRIEGRGGTTIGLGGDGSDVLTGRSAEEALIGGDGRDLIAGRGGNDLLAGLGGLDRIFGGAGRDVLVGGRGRDRLRGGPGRDEEHQDGLPRGFRPDGMFGFLEFLVLPGRRDVGPDSRALRSAALALLERGHRQAR